MKGIIPVVAAVTVAAMGMAPVYAAVKVDASTNVLPKDILVMCRTGGKLDVFLSSDKKGKAHFSLGTENLILSPKGAELAPGQCGVFDRALPGKHHFDEELGNIPLSVQCSTGKDTIYHCGTSAAPYYDRIKDTKGDVIFQFTAQPVKKSSNEWTIKKWHGARPAR